MRNWRQFLDKVLFLHFDSASRNSSYSKLCNKLAAHEICVVSSSTLHWRKYCFSVHETFKISNRCGNPASTKVKFKKRSSKRIERRKLRLNLTIVVETALEFWFCSGCPRRLNLNWRRETWVEMWHLLLMDLLWVLFHKRIRWDLINWNHWKRLSLYRLQ